MSLNKYIYVLNILIFFKYFKLCFDCFFDCVFVSDSFGFLVQLVEFRDHSKMFFFSTERKQMEISSY